MYSMQYNSIHSNMSVSDHAYKCNAHGKQNDDIKASEGIIKAKGLPVYPNGSPS